MKLGLFDKFFITDDEDNLILINEIKCPTEMSKNGWMEFRGTKFYVDYENETIEKGNSCVVQMSFYVENIEEVE